MAQCRESESREGVARECLFTLLRKGDAWELSRVETEPGRGGRSRSLTAADCYGWGQSGSQPLGVPHRQRRGEKGLTIPTLDSHCAAA